MSVVTLYPLLCVTAADMIARGPCDEKFVRKAWGGRCLTALEVLDLDISSEEKLIIVIAGQITPEKILVNLACDFLERALPVWEQWAARNARKYLTAPRWGVAVSREGITGLDLVNAYQDVALAIDTTWSAAPDVRFTPASAAHFTATGVLSLLGGWNHAAAFRASHAVAEHAASRLGRTADHTEQFVTAKDAREAERKWQVERVREVLQGGD